MANTIATTTIVPSKAPNLPIGPVEYSQQFQDQFSNVLRLYFNQIDNDWSAILGTNGGQYIRFPYAQFHYDEQISLTNALTTTSTTPINVSSTTGFVAPGVMLIGTELIQYTTIPNSTTFYGTITRGAYGTTKAAHAAGVAVTSAQGTTADTRTNAIFNVIDYDNGITLVPPSGVFTCTIPGIYNIQFSAQFSNSDTAADNVTMWYRVNNADIPASSGIVAVPGSHGGLSGQTIIGWNGLQELRAGDTFELLWITDSGNSVLTTYPAGTTGGVHPTSPAIIITFQFVSALST